MNNILIAIVAIASLSITVLLIWYLACVFTQKKIKRVCIVVTIVALGVFLYFHSNPRVVRQKEDVLYVKPMPK
jgi:predicted membrane chloride channel (bestrophin family)